MKKFQPIDLLLAMPAAAAIIHAAIVRYGYKALEIYITMFHR